LHRFEMKMENFPKNSEKLPEILVANGDKKYSYYLSDLVKKGLVRKVVPKIYTSNLNDSNETIVRRNLFLILGRLFPEAVVSHRSAFEMKPTDTGDFFLTYKYMKKVKLPGLVVHLLEGPSGQPEDTPFVNGLFIACPERAFLRTCKRSIKKRKMRNVCLNLLSKTDWRRSSASMERLPSMLYATRPEPYRNDWK